MTDDKAGHQNQLRGLVQALNTLIPVTSYDWNAGTQSGETPIPPDVILASGRPTQFTGLRLRWRHGGKLVVIGNPSLPKWLFDLCIIPRHDGVPDGKRVITTQGAMNRVTPPASPAPDAKQRGLILIGGAAKYYTWSSRHMCRQLAELKSLLPAIHWTLTTSRRTPADFLSEIESLKDERFTVTPVEQTSPQWLQEQFQSCGTIWATEDSVSMVYESLSAGASAGILPVPRQKAGRVSRGLEQLVDEGRVTTLAQLRQTGSLRDNPQPLQEARRVATYLLDWLDLPPGAVS